MAVDVSVDAFNLPSPMDLAAGALGLRGPEGLLVSWALILAGAIVSSSVGLLFMLAIIPIALFMLGVGFVWLALDRTGVL